MCKNQNIFWSKTELNKERVIFIFWGRGYTLGYISHPKASNGGQNLNIYHPAGPT